MCRESPTVWWLRPIVEAVRDYGISACEKKALSLAHEMKLNGPIVNVGGGRTTRWRNAETVDAMYNYQIDFNTVSLPFNQRSLGLVVCEQVVEHLHNTTWFLSELWRVLKEGGQLLLSTENLVSLPNLFAMLLQRAPFSTQAVCGRFIGGWKTGPAGEDDGIPESDPVFSGTHGHVRVMTTGQVWELLRQAGFRNIRKWGFAGNHYILFAAQK